MAAHVVPFLFLILLNCQPSRQVSTQESSLDSLDVSAPIDINAITRDLAEAIGGVSPDEINNVVNKYSLDEYWRELDTLDTKGALIFKTRAVALSESEIQKTKSKKAKNRRNYPQKSIRAHLGPELNSWNFDEFQTSLLELTAFVAADESIAEGSSLNLVAPQEKLSDLKKLAKTGLDIYNSPRSAIPYALDKETWTLIERNKKIINFSLYLATKLKPQSTKVKRAAQIVRGVTTASDFMTAQFEGREFMPTTVSALD